MSADDICMVDRASHYVTVQKVKQSASPCKEDDIKLQKEVCLGRSESEKSLMDEGSPDSSEHQPLQPAKQHQECMNDMDKQPQDMETSQEFSKQSTSVSRKNQMTEDTSKSKCNKNPVRSLCSMYTIQPADVSISNLLHFI